MPRRLAALLIVMALATFAFGQKKSKVPTERSVSGVVTNEMGEPIAGAIVQLENTRTMQVRSFITKEKGEYYFHELSTDIDYKFTAKWNGRTSETRTLSSFDSHP